MNDKCHHHGHRSKQKNDFYNFFLQSHHYYLTVNLYFDIFCYFTKNFFSPKWLLWMEKSLFEIIFHWSNYLLHNHRHRQQTKVLNYLFKDIDASGQWLWHSWQSGRFQYQRSRFEFSHRQLLLNNYLLLSVYRKDEKRYLGRWKPNEPISHSVPFIKRDTFERQTREMTRWAVRKCQLNVYLK